MPRDLRFERSTRMELSNQVAQREHHKRRVRDWIAPARKRRQKTLLERLESFLARQYADDLLIAAGARMARWWAEWDTDMRVGMAGVACLFALGGILYVWG